MESPPAQPVVLALTNGTDVLVDLGVDRRAVAMLGRNGRGRSRHSAKIGIPARVLDAREAEGRKFPPSRDRDTPPE
jgi:hypothetical protein